MEENSFLKVIFQEVIHSLAGKYYYKNDAAGNWNLNPLNYFKNQLLYKRFVSKNSIREIQERLNEIVYKQEAEFTWLYNVLEDHDSKNILIALISYRVLGHDKYIMPLNTGAYWEERKHIGKNKINEVFPSGNGNKRKLYKHDLHYHDIDLRLFHFTEGIQATFFREQYGYKTAETTIRAAKDDVVIDAGACYGDTALYFASLAGRQGAVYSFEFIPENLAVFNRNIELNPQYKENIRLIPLALSDKDDVVNYFLDYGAGSVLSEDKPASFDGIVKTVTIDTFFNNIGEKKVDFIKMDIEGSELKALKGGEQIIRKFRPKLAISVYHHPEDLYIIPQWLDSLNLGYKFYLGHFTTHNEETILFAG
jgi:FkbM family methyltransferase